jgi:hypothetical protein
MTFHILQMTLCGRAGNAKFNFPVIYDLPMQFAAPLAMRAGIFMDSGNAFSRPNASFEVVNI